MRTNISIKFFNNSLIVVMFVDISKYVSKYMLTLYYNHVNMYLNNKKKTFTANII